MFFFQFVSYGDGTMRRPALRPACGPTEARGLSQLATPDTNHRLHLHLDVPVTAGPVILKLSNSYLK